MQRRRGAVINHGDGGAAAGGEVGRVQGHLCHRHAGGRLGSHFAAVQVAILVGVARNRDHGRGRRTDVLGYAGCVAAGAIAVLIGLRRRDGSRMRVAGIGEVQRDRAAAVGAGNAIGCASDGAVRRDVQGCGHPVIDHRHRRAAVGGQVGGIQCHRCHGHAGCGLSRDFAAAQDAVMIGVARDRHGGCGRRRNMLGHRRRVAVCAVAVLVGLRCRHGGRVGIARIGKVHRHRAAAVSAGNAVCRTCDRTIRSNRQCRGHAIVDHRDSRAAACGQVGRIQGHRRHCHTGSRLSGDFAAAQYAIVIGIAGDRHHRCRRRTDVFNHAGRIAVGRVAVLIRLCCRDRGAMRVARIGKVHRDGAAAVGARHAVGCTCDSAIGSDGQGRRHAVVDHSHRGAAAGCQAGGVQCHRRDSHAGSRLSGDFAAAQYAIVVGIARNRHHRSRRCADVLGDRCRVAVGAIAILIGLCCRDRCGMGIARIGEIHGHRAAAVSARNAVCCAGHRAVRCDVQGCGHAVVDHRHRRAAAGGQVGGIQRHRRHRHAGSRLSGDFAAAQYAIVVGIAGDRHHRGRRRADVFGHAGRIAVGRVAVLIRLCRRDRGAVRVARIGEVDRDRAAAVGARHTIGCAGDGAVGGDVQGGRNAIVDHGHCGATAGGQIGRIQSHGGNGHTGGCLGSDFAAIQHTVMVGVAGDRHNRSRRRRDMLGHRCRVAVCAIAVLVGLRRRHGGRVGIARIGKVHRHRAAAVSAGNAICCTCDRAVRGNSQCRADAIVDNGDGRAAAGSQIGCIQCHRCHCHTCRSFSRNFATAQYAVMIGVARNRHHRRGRRADVLGHAGGIAVGRVAVLVGLRCRNGGAVRVAWIGKVQRDRAAAVGAGYAVGCTGHRAVRRHRQRGADTVVDHGHLGAAVGGQVGGIERHRCDGHAARGFCRDFAAVQHAVVIRVACDRHHRHRRRADVFGHAGGVADGRIAILVALRGGDRGAMRIARIGKVHRHRAAAVCTGDAIGCASDGAVRGNVQGRGDTIVHHSNRRAAAGGQTGRVQGNRSHCHTGRRLSRNFAAGEHAVVIGVAGDRHNRSRRRADMFGHAGGVAVGRVTVLVGLGCRDRGAMRIAGIGEIHRHGAAAVGAGDAIGCASDGAIRGNVQGCADTVIHDRNRRTAAGSQVGCIQGHRRHRHTSRGFGGNFAAREHAIMVGVAGDRHHRCRQRAQVFHHACAVGGGDIAILVGLRGADACAIGVARIGKVDRHVTAAVRARDAVGGAGHGAVRSDVQGGRHAVVDHRDGGAAVGGQIGGIERNVADCNAGRGFGCDLVAAQYAVVIGVSGDAHRRRGRRCDVFGDAGRVAVGRVAVLIALRGCDRGAMRVARVGEAHRHRAAAVSAGNTVGGAADGAIGGDVQGRRDAIVDHRYRGAAAGGEVGGVERYRRHRNAGGRFRRHFTATQYAVMIGIAGDRDNRSRRGADVLGHARAVRRGRIAVLIGLRGTDRGRVRVARIGKIQRDGATAIGARYAIGGASHRTVRGDVQGRGYAIVDYRHCGTAVGRQAGGIQGHRRHCHAGRRLGVDFAAVQHTVMVGVAGDRDDRRGRRADVFGHAGAVRGRGIAVLVGLGRTDRGAVRIARIGEVQRQVAVAVGTGHAVGGAGHGTVRSYVQGGGNTVVDYRDIGAAVGRQIGRVQCDRGNRHACDGFGTDFAAREHAVLVGVAGDGHRRRGRGAGMLGHAGDIAVAGIAVLVGLRGCDRGGIAVARIGEVDRHVAVAVAGRDAVGSASHRTVGRDTQGRGYAIVDHGYRGAAVGGKARRIQCDVGNCHAGRGFGIDFAAAQDAVMIGVAGDRDRRRRAAGVLGDAGAVRARGVAVLVSLRGRNRSRIAVAGIVERQCDRAVAVSTRHAIGGAGDGAVGRHSQCGGNAVVEHGNGGAAIGSQAGRIERHGGLRHARRAFSGNLAAAQDAIVIGIAGDRDRRCCRRADVFGDAGAVAVGRVAVLIGLRRRDRGAIAIARIGKVHRHIAVAVGGRDAVGGAGDRAVGGNVQGRGHTIVDHGHRRAAVGRKAGRIQRDVGNRHAGRCFARHFAAREHAIVVRVARDRDHRRRRADMLNGSRGIAVGRIAVLVGLRGAD